MGNKKFPYFRRTELNRIKK